MAQSTKAKAAETLTYQKLGKTEAPTTEEGRTPAANSDTQTAQAKTAAETTTVLATEASLAAAVALVEAEAVEEREKSQKSAWRLNRRESADRACRRRWVTQQARGRWGTAAEEITARGVWKRRRSC